MNLKKLLEKKTLAIISVPDTALLSESIKTMYEKNIGAVIVLDKDGQLAGVLSERDVLRVAQQHPQDISSTPVREAMTPVSKLITVASNRRVHDVMELMTFHRVRHLPVIDGTKLVGIVSIGDIVKEMLATLGEEKEQLLNYISG